MQHRYMLHASIMMMAACCSLAACGSSEDSSSNGAEKKHPTKERKRLPEPSGPKLTDKFGGSFPVEMQMVGVEAGPTLGESPDKPGKTTLGVLMQVRGKLTDRPTPRDHPTSVRVHLPVAEEKCFTIPGGEFSRGQCSSATQEQTNYITKKQAQARGLAQFKPLSSPTEWKDGDLPAGVPQYIELFFSGMDKHILESKSNKLCNDKDQCVKIADVRKLPAR